MMVKSDRQQTFDMFKERDCIKCDIEAKGQKQAHGMEQYRLNEMEGRRNEDDIMWQLAKQQREENKHPHHGILNHVYLDF